MADDEMVAWLVATLDEMERVAHAAMSRPVDDGVWQRDDWDDDEEEGVYRREVVGPDLFKIYDEGGHTAADADHIALHDPRAVLARIQAERAMLARLAAVETEQAGASFTDAVDQTGETLRLLAHGHRFDAPGYRDEWTPA